MRHRIGVKSTGQRRQQAGESANSYGSQARPHNSRNCTQCRQQDCGCEEGEKVERDKGRRPCVGELGPDTAGKDEGKHEDVKQE
jgi:hypothetical protein